MAVLKAMGPHFKKYKTSQTIKPSIYNSIVTPTYMYATDTLARTYGRRKSLNTTQLKGLRQIFKSHTTFINRRNTNTHIIELAQEALYRPALFKETRRLQTPHRHLRPRNNKQAWYHLKAMTHTPSQTLHHNPQHTPTAHPSKKKSRET